MSVKSLLVFACLAFAPLTTTFAALPASNNPRAETAHPHSSASSGAKKAAPSSDRLQAEYMRALQHAVQINWLRPESAGHDLHCTVRMRQDDAGMVVELQIIEPCNADEATRRSIRAAVYRAQPLPHDGFTAVLAQSVQFVFRYD